MAGASDPLEDMLFNEVDEKAVSDLVGSLESQLGDRKAPAAPYSEEKREGAPAAGSQFSGKVRDQVGSLEQPQQGHPKAGVNQKPGADESLPGKTLPSSTSTVAPGAAPAAAASLPTVAAPPAAPSAPGPVTLNTPSAASFHRAAVLGPSAAPSTTIVPVGDSTRTASPGLQSLNGGPGGVKLGNSAPAPPAAGANTVISTVSAGGSTIIVSMASQPTFPVPQSQVTSGTLQRHPSPVTSVAQNGVDPKGAQLVAQCSASASAPAAQTNPGLHPKMLLPSQPPPGGSVILTNTPPPAAEQPPVGPPQVDTKPAVNGVAQQPPVAVVRPPGSPVVAPSVQQQRPGLVASSPRVAAPQPQLAVRPQQQTTIQLPSGFTIPPGMVLVRTETGQLIMVPQQVLAQAQAKLQQGQTVANITQRPATPTATTPSGSAPPLRLLRLSAWPPPPSPEWFSLPPPAQCSDVRDQGFTCEQIKARLPVGSPSGGQAIAVAPGGAEVSKMTSAPTAQTVMAAGGMPLAKPAVNPSAPQSSTPAAAPAPAASRVTVVSQVGARVQPHPDPSLSDAPLLHPKQEMQENVKKCKNFLATLIKLASHNSPSPDTSKNVKALVQDLLDAKIEPEEFTSRLQAELKSSPQPYLIPFLKKSLPALRQSLLSSQQSLVTPPTPPLAAPGSVTATTIRPRVPISPVGATVRLNTPLASTVAVGRTGVQTVQTRTPVVFSQTIRPQGSIVRGPTTIIGKSPVHLAVQANQKKPSDPGGGTFRDDDDINDVASMAGVNLNEESARILATSSELVGTKIRSCKDESFLPAGLLHRRILDTAKKLGVSEVPLEVVNFISHATQSRLRSLLEKVSAVAQHRTDGGKDEECCEQTSDVRSQLRFFEQLERIEKQRKDEQEREILLKAAKSRARQEDPEQARLKQKAKEVGRDQQTALTHRREQLYLRSTASLALDCYVEGGVQGQSPRADICSQDRSMTRDRRSDPQVGPRVGPAGRTRRSDPQVDRGSDRGSDPQMQQQELAQMRQRDANLTALAAIGPRKKRKLDSPGGAAAGTEVGRLRHPLWRRPRGKMASLR
ncbi:TFIID subunit 4 RNA polymerase II TBP-associated factor subunit C [Takifugu flavidus]|uniref:TFIID subunit 4 RNA polymerase II TBP-associated factor subunit C n=1 Tax=Takifugu flavidus TaxID=433684 RepID=A0A5C6P9J7_9TELE|nr:TFIID subunit 4 RNA polymerase II TBP-associated factor subunit C [Takifugu flavidus]